MTSDSVTRPLANRIPYRFIDILNRAKANEGDADAEVDKMQALIDLYGGDVYVAHLSPSPFYKIGMSKNVDIRMTTIMHVDSPFDFVSVHTIGSNYIAAVEHMLQDRFINRHWRGEWYKLEQDDLDFVKTIKRYDFPEVDEAKEFIRQYNKTQAPPAPQPLNFGKIYPRVYGISASSVTRPQIEKAG